MSIPLIAGLGPQELIIIAVVLVLLFGAKKLPELARGSGQALRIFKAETKALSEDDDKKTPEQRDIDARNEATSYEAPPQKPTANPGEQGEPERRTDTPG
ncbi:MAG TPA: Sec-independent protein translocase subunit TatA [Marmoricola sp.]|jgi:sec-independent protein translocase protein TatA|nr:Sec-independent protein translocase subunit TatA [Marmoricola sp.]